MLACFALFGAAASAPGTALGTEPAALSPAALPQTRIPAPAPSPAPPQAAQEPPAGEDDSEARPGDLPPLPADLSAAARRAAEEAIALYEQAAGSRRARGRRIREAVYKLSAAARRAPNAARIHWYLGKAYLLDGKRDRALRAFEKAAELAPDSAAVLEALAATYRRARRWEDALSTYRKLAVLRPRDARAHEKLGETLALAGRFKEAAAAMAKAFRLEPNIYRAWYLKELQTELHGPPWEETFTAETDNYRVLTNVSEDFARLIAGRAELVRRAYAAVFPDVPRPERKYTIWVYASREEYHKAGAPPQAGGHYSPLVRKLVLFRYPNLEDTILVLNHEAFHQYLHDYLDEAPQWFNEGLGDYFGPFEYVREGRREYMRSRPNPWRLKIIREALKRNLCPPVADLMLMSRREMYHPRLGGVYYAQAWSVIYFLMEGPDRSYRKLLVKYFHSLTKGYGRNRAFEDTFGRIDMERFEREWKTFTLKIPAQR